MRHLLSLLALVVLSTACATVPADRAVEPPPTSASNEVVHRFLLSTLPDSTRSSLQLLASLSFPLHDHSSFAHHVAAKADDELWSDERRRAAQAPVERLIPADFPLITAQSALEKYYSRLAFGELSRFIVPAAPGQERPARNIEAEYLAMFGPFCGAVAWRTYLDLRRDFHEVRAYADGVFAGRSCLTSR